MRLELTTFTLAIRSASRQKAPKTPVFTGILSSL
jgi:hypothetical protein